ncbi:MAG: pyridoxal-phosphate dependent enzyme [Rhodobacteraceae bacterium]|nr:pyridoxal-phosphate dependent enzyme [Paracoccaceae bacterium]
MTNKPTFDPTRPLELLKACSVYASTPLVDAVIKNRHVLIKDESARMGLGAFKALGGIYAVGQMIKETIGTPITSAELLADKMQDKAKSLTFICASAGNHGLAVATGAALFGACARVHLATPVPEEFAQRLRAKGAQVVRSGDTYEASIIAAMADAAQNDGIHLADGSWPGYTHAPHLVMEGYTVMAEEMRAAFETRGQWPTRVYLQAGVGGLAAAISYMIRLNWREQPEIIIVEPTAAPCLAESVAAGKLVTVSGPVSDMGRLDCKDASLLAFEILRDAADRFVTISELQAKSAVAAAETAGFSTTPSGAAGLAVALAETSERPLVILSETAMGGT